MFHNMVHVSAHNSNRRMDRKCFIILHRHGPKVSLKVAHN